MTEIQLRLKRGFIGEDGLVFWGLIKGKQSWISPEELVRRKEKARLDMIEWRKANPLKPLEAARNWRRKNPEKVKLAWKQWKIKNQEKFKDQQREWRFKHREKLNLISKIKYQKQKASNPEKFREKKRITSRNWRLKNPEKFKESREKWVRSNAAKLTQYVQHREALKKSAIPNDCWKKAVDQIFEISERVSKCLGIRHEVDHVMPISKGGSHCHRNLQVIPAKFNRHKSARLNYQLPHPYRNTGWSKISGEVQLSPPASTTP